MMASALPLPSYVNHDLTERSESLGGFTFLQHDGFFYPLERVQGIKAMSDSFQPLPDDVFLCSAPKTGTTWTKAILASIVSNTKLLKENNPHDLIPTLEIGCYGPSAMPNASQFLAEMPSPRVMHTHLPYNSLLQPIKSLGCKIVYITRNPKDVFVSYWRFLKDVQVAFDFEGDISKEVVFDGFCRGLSSYGPFIDHVLSYWNASRDNSNILFLTYEDLVADTSGGIRRIADFLGMSSLTEEGIDKICEECSFQCLSSLDVNKQGKLRTWSRNSMETKSFFRKGEVADWKNHFTEEMNIRLDLIVEAKLEGSGFSFRYE